MTEMSQDASSPVHPISADESTKIAMLRWPLIVLVIFIHANNDRIGAFAPEGGAARTTHLVRQFLSEGIAATAVPLFFLIAGRLFFRRAGLSVDEYTAKLRSRVRTLLVPYVLWNVMLATVYLVAQGVPALASVVGDRAQVGPLELVTQTIGIGRAPVSYQFWFIRDLMIVCLLAPVWARFLGRLAWIPILLIGVPWLLHVWPSSLIRAVGPLFFFVGACFGARGRSLFPPAGALIGLLPLFAALLCVDYLGYAGDLFPYVRQVGIVVGVATVLATTSALSRVDAVRRCATLLAGSAFFLFAVHEPLLSLVTRVAQRGANPLTPAKDLAIYFGAVAIVIAAAFAVEFVLRRVWPKAYAILTGGRS